MPPVMGAAAFIMAETTGVPYLQICIAAAIPAVLYYMCVMLSVDFEARRGAAMADKTMYFAVVGSPMPRIMDATMVNRSVRKRSPPEILFCCLSRH